MTNPFYAKGEGGEVEGEGGGGEGGGGGGEGEGGGDGGGGGGAPPEWLRGGVDNQADEEDASGLVLELKPTIRNCMLVHIRNHRPLGAAAHGGPPSPRRGGLRTRSSRSVTHADPGAEADESGEQVIAEYERWFHEEVPHYLNEQKGELQVGRILSTQAMMWRLLCIAVVKAPTPSVHNASSTIRI